MPAKVIKDRVLWCDRGWLPFYYGFCPNEKAWKYEMKRLGCPDEPYPQTEGRCTIFDKKGDMCIIVTVNRKSGVDDAQLMGLLVHEATHIKQHVMRHIGEKEPSQEFEAYAMQAVFMCLMDAYAKTCT